MNKTLYLEEEVLENGFSMTFITLPTGEKWYEARGNFNLIPVRDSVDTVIKLFRKPIAGNPYLEKYNELRFATIKLNRPGGYIRTGAAVRLISLDDALDKIHPDLDQVIVEGLRKLEEDHPDMFLSDWD